jgi:nucleoside-triphosphatase THEP1
MRKEHVSFFRQLNEKVKEMNELTKKYNYQANKLHDVILIIRELKIELKERSFSENVSANSNTLLFIIEDDAVVSTFKKLSDSSIFIDDKDLIIND